MENDPKTRVDSAPGIVTDLELMLGDVAAMVPFAISRPALASRMGKLITNLADLIARIQSFTVVASAPERDIVLDFDLARNPMSPEAFALWRDKLNASLASLQADNQPDGGDHDPAREKAPQEAQESREADLERDCSAKPAEASGEALSLPETAVPLATLEPGGRDENGTCQTCGAPAYLLHQPSCMYALVEQRHMEALQRKILEAPPQETEALSAPAGTEEVEAGEVRGVEPTPAPAPKEHKARYASSASQQALDLYATTTMTYAEIASALGLAPATPKALVSKNRSEGDPRVAQGDAARQKVIDGESFVRGRRTEQALDLYATTTMTMAEIGRRCGFEFDVCRSVIRSKVQNRDPRALAGQKLRGEGLPDKVAPEAITPPPKPEPVIDMPAKAEIALDLYADTTITKTGIADRVGLPMAVVKDVFTDAKATGDTRVQKGDTARAAAIDALKAAPVVGTPFLFVAHGCIEIDEAAGMVRGPKGAKSFSKPQIRALKVLSKIPPGSYLDAQALAFRTQWGTPQAFVEQFPLVERPLAEIGIELGRVGKNMFFIREAKA